MLNPETTQANPRGRQLPGRESVLMLVTVRLKCVAEAKWGSRRYLDVTLLDDGCLMSGRTGWRAYGLSESVRES